MINFMFATINFNVTNDAALQPRSLNEERKHCLGRDKETWIEMRDREKEGWRERGVIKLV